MVDTVAAQPAPSAVRSRPYAPSLFDRFTDRIEALNLPVGTFYAGFSVVLAGLQLAVQFASRAGEVYAFPLVYILTIAYVLGLMHTLDAIAAQALARFRPLLALDDAEHDQLLYRLTTLPARPALAAGLIGALVGISMLEWLPYSAKIHDLHFADTPLSIHFNHGLTLLICAIIGVLVYHTLHQLRVVQQIYNLCSGVDLYDLRPVYAFSTLSASASVGIALIVYVWYLFAPLLFNIGVAALVFFTGLALLTFALPLRSARRLLVEEKERRLSENGARRRLAFAELQRRVDSGAMVAMDDLNKTVATLELERAALDRISTWPWKSETLRAVAAALFFPVMVWLTQWLLRRLLEP